MTACLVVFVLRSSHAQARDLEALGGYEREALAEVLAQRKLTIDPEPEGKTIAEIHIANLDVFGADTGGLRILNHLHRTSLESTIRSQLLVRGGELWNEARILETERILRNPTLSSVVVAMPVRSAEEGSVDLLVVTRDIWSLRSNSEFVYQEGRFTSLKIAAAENNLLGKRKHVSLILEMDQGEYSLSSRWRDLNVLGTRLQFVFRPYLLFGRESDKFEGTQSFTRLAYPLWSLASQWGFLAELAHKDATSRTFQGGALATYDNPDTAEVEALPQEFRRSDISLTTSVTRSFGVAYKHSFSLGHELLQTRPRLLRDPTLGLVLAKAFARDLFPRDELSSAATLQYGIFEPRYVTYRNIESYDLPEVRIAGPSATVDLALALRAFGSEKTFARYRLRAGYLFDFHADSLLQLGFTVSRRQETTSGGTRFVDVVHGGDWLAASPVLPGSVRLVAHGAASLSTDNEENTIVHLGGQEDLRGYPVGTFSGTSFVRSSVELRSLPTRLAFMRVGYLAFWDAGHAAARIRDLRLHHNIGLGIKALIPQTGASLLFLYWAVPLDRDSERLPGRISLGYEQEL